MSSSGSYSGTNYDRWSYEQAAKGGTLADTPINRLQHKYWVAKQVNVVLEQKNDWFAFQDAGKILLVILKIKESIKMNFYGQ